ncbi:MAG: hydantoinase/oxoprolinase N-terminal domain-containing protein, partial [Verrucomicrobiota bacterium]
MKGGSPWKVRVDTGGTFTDAWCRTPDGEERRCKVLSDGRMRIELRSTDDGAWIMAEALPDGFLNGWQAEGGITVETQQGDRLKIVGDFDGGVLELDGGEEAPVVAARLLTATPRDGDLPPMDFRVATTRGTNALLERKGARVAFFLTRGFEDLLRIRDQRRDALFSLKQPEPEPLADEVIGVGGRLDAAGDELLALDEQEVRHAARRAREAGCEVAAVALMHAWRNPDHEQKVGGWLRDEGFGQVTLSHEVAPLIR